MQWNRHDEHGWDPKGPPTLIDLEAALDAKGDLQTWSSRFYVPQGAAGLVPLTPATLGALQFTDVLSPGGITGNTSIQYAIPNVRTVAHRLETTPLRPSWIRTPGRMQNIYANDSFMDEIALAGGASIRSTIAGSAQLQKACELLNRDTTSSNSTTWILSRYCKSFDTRHTSQYVDNGTCRIFRTMLRTRNSQM